MDPLSEVLSLLKPRSYSSGGFSVPESIAVRFPKHDGIKCYAVVSGQCWLSVEGVSDPVRLTEGDCFLLPRGRPFCLTCDLTLTPVDFFTLLASLRDGISLSPNGTDPCYLVGGHFRLAGNHPDMLLGFLPSIVHIREESDKAAMRWSLERMREELRNPQPGGVLVAQQLAYVMLVQALRLHLAEGLKGGVGWLFALADKQMSAAIACIHDAPAHRWTIQELAERVGMSRSTFALKFKETVGTAPMEYLTRWRMLLAGDRLSNSDESVSVIALSLGYESESAFSKAFRRVMGRSPRRYSRHAIPIPSSEADRKVAPVARLALVAD